MDLPAFHRLLTAEGQAALAAAVELRPTAATLLAAHQHLRKRFPDELSKAAIETALLRQKAAAKFSHANCMYFTREALEQASGEVVGTYRAARFGGADRVGDLCCGVGGDLIGLAAVADVVALDADPLRLAMAEENLKAYGREDRATFIPGDVLSLALPDFGRAFLDPDRRAGGARRLRLRDYAPPLDAVLARFPAGFPLGVKVAPGVPWDDLRGHDAEAEFISVDGELKECALWFGPLKTAGRRATVLPAAATLFADRPARPTAPGPPLAYLYDPDPAVVRSGLVTDLGQELGARPIDAEIAYLTSDRPTLTPFARGYAIEEAMPFHARRLGERLRAMNVGPVTVTKRGSAVDVDELKRRWKLTGPEARTVVLTRVLGRAFALVVRPVTGEPGRLTSGFE